jgi:hypothetical protein
MFYRLGMLPASSDLSRLLKCLQTNFADFGPTEIGGRMGSQSGYRIACLDGQEASKELFAIGPDIGCGLDDRLDLQRRAA